MARQRSLDLGGERAVVVLWAQLIAAVAQRGPSATRRKRGTS